MSLLEQREEWGWPGVETEPGGTEKKRGGKELVGNKPVQGRTE